MITGTGKKEQTPKLFWQIQTSLFTTLMNSAYTFKIFVGFPINSSLRLQLERSEAWKAAKIDRHGLVENPFNGQTYLGKFAPSLPLKILDVRKIEENVLSMLHSYCPEADIRKVKPVIFSQCFVGV